jgi:hypothetical protein
MFSQSAIRTGQQKPGKRRAETKMALTAVKNGAAANGETATIHSTILKELRSATASTKSTSAAKTVQSAIRV